MDEENYIELNECKAGKVYRLQSRNLAFGVYDGREGFIGIRTKFSDRFLFTEYHWDQGPPYGTVKPLQELDDVLDPLLVLADHLGSQCYYCRRPVEFEKWTEDERKARETEDLYIGTGRWLRSGGEDCPCNGADVRPVSISNQALFTALEEIEDKYSDTADDQQGPSWDDKS